MSDQQSLALRQAGTLAPQTFDDPMKELIRKAVSDPRQPLTNDEFDLFMAVVQHTGLNPLLKEIYPVRLDGRLTILPGIDGYRKKAQQSPRFRGMAGPFWCGPDGKWTDVWLDATAPVACKVGVYLPGAAEPTWGVAYYKNYKNRRSATWSSQPEHMLAVRAEAFALRRCFARELGALPMPHDDDAGYAAEIEAPEPQDSHRPALTPRRYESPPDGGRVEVAAVPAGEMSPKAKAVVAEMDAAVAEGEAHEIPATAVPDWATGDPDFEAAVRDVFARACAQGLLPTYPPDNVARRPVEKWLAHWRKEVEALEAPDPNIAALAEAKAKADATPDSPTMAAAKERVAKRVEEARHAPTDGKTGAAASSEATSEAVTPAAPTGANAARVEEHQAEWDALGLPDDPPAANAVDRLADEVSAEAGMDADTGERPLTGWQADPVLNKEVGAIVDVLSTLKAKDGQPLRFLVPVASAPVVEVRRWIGTQQTRIKQLAPAQ